MVFTIKQTMEFNLTPDILKILSSYTALCLFSNMTTKFSVTELFDNLMESQEFTDFQDQNQDKTGKQVGTEFVKNTIYSFADPFVGFVLDDPEFNNILNDQTLSKENQLKAFLAKVLIKTLTGKYDMPSQIDRNQFGQTINEYSTILSQINGVNDAKTPTDLYHIIVDHVTNEIINEHHKNMDVLKLL